MRLSRLQLKEDLLPGLPGLPGSIRRLGCHGWPSAGEKSLKLKNTPLHSPNDGQASPYHASYSTHTPILIACSILCLALSFLILSYTCTTIHQFLISNSVPESLGTCFSLSFSLSFSIQSCIQSFITQKLSPTISHPLSA